MNLTVLSPRLFTIHDSITVCPGITSIELGTFPKEGLNSDIFRKFAVSPYFVNGGSCCCQTELSVMVKVNVMNIKVDED